MSLQRCSVSANLSSISKKRAAAVLCSRLLFAVCCFLLAAVLFLQSGCSSKSSAMHKVIAVVSVEPHAFLVERIGGQRVSVEVLIPSGKEPETYQVTPDKLITFSQAHVFFRTGMPMEEHLLPKLDTLSNKLRVVDLRAGIPLRNLEIHHHASEPITNIKESEPAIQKHTHNDQTDPHIWFAPTLLKTEAKTVLETLRQCDPAGAEEYQTNYENVIQEIETVRLEIVKMLASRQGDVLFVFHPSYGYFCEEFGLKQWAIEYEGKSPKPQQIAEMIEAAKGLSSIPKIFVQPEFSQSSARALAESLSAQMIVHSTLERDVLQNLRFFAQNIGE